MAQTTGKVITLKLSLAGIDPGNDGAFFQIRTAGGNEDFFWVWWTESDNYFPTAVDWITRNMVVAMLRDALRDQLTVTVSHGALGGEITQLILHEPE